MSLINFEKSNYLLFSLIPQICVPKEKGKTIQIKKAEQKIIGQSRKCTLLHSGNEENNNAKINYLKFFSGLCI